MTSFEVSTLRKCQSFLLKCWFSFDESGFDHRDAMRQYGYSPRGQPCRAVTHLQRRSIIAAMCTDGVIGTQIFEGGVNAKCLQNYMEMNSAAVFFLSMESILEVHVVILDNASINLASRPGLSSF